MPQTKATELKNLSVDELNEKHDQLKKELFQLRVQAKLQKLTSFSGIKKTKRLIARVLTVRRVRQLEQKKTNG